MTVKAKLTAVGMTRNKKYDVIENNDKLNCYKIVLDDGTIAYRIRTAFDVVSK